MPDGPIVEVGRGERNPRRHNRRDIMSTRSETESWPKRIRVGGYAESELDIQHEDCCPDDGDCYRLFSVWDGSAVVVFDADHAESLASIAVDIGNGWDCDISGGRYNGEQRIFATAIRDGFYRLSARLRAVRG